ncbi:YrdB family protein [Paenibacillus filicis]|uniref:YrdB family protein n=1 Tax=Paenibacillus gyeongsangnamensis TaxID=3388067 RepID=A0ABT4Q8D1_9BACL|nr:YrdB family protein [Paenibacillus filicis]MCZ8513144.1 YrdB family protein [Paenibacillus filicis]
MGVEMLVSLLKSLNLILRFLLEVCVVIALGYWGFKTGSSTAAKYIIGLGTPLLIMVVWGTFGSPGASIPLVGWPLLMLEIVIFGLAVAALYGTSLPKLAAVMGGVFVINRILMYMWGQ